MPASSRRAAVSRGTALSLLLLAVFASFARAQTDTWLEVHTPHFVVISNSKESDARRVTRQFERMRTVFRKVFPDANLDSSTPIVVLAVEDKRNLQALEPEIYRRQGQVNIAGLFLRAPEKNYVLVYQNAEGLHPFAPIYHEYTHFVLASTGEWMPVWLSEGWAEFYQNTEIVASEVEVRIGKLDAYMLEFLQRNPLLPLATVLAVDQHSPYYHEDDKGSMFYAESWALTHYLKARDSRENTHRLLDYLDLVHKKVDSVSAATQAFGDLQELQTELHKYIVNGDYSFLTMPGSTDVDDSAFVLRTLSGPQADTVRADFLAYCQRGEDARTLLEAVLHNDPNNASARETMGYIAFHQRNFEEAHKWYEQAVQLDPQSFLAHYYFAVSAIKLSDAKKRLPDAAEQASIENSLRTAVKLNPSFAPGYDSLGVFLAMLGKGHDEGHQLTQKAIQLDLGTVEFRIDDANVLMRMNKDKEAIEELELAVKMAHTSEQTAAVESVLQATRQFEAERTKLQRQNTASHNKTASIVGGGSALIGPRTIYSPEPEYTEEARQARREGTCVVSFIVGLDGKPSHIVVTKKLGMGLDQKAVEAVSKSRFEPARRYGRPVMIRLNLSVSFKLYGAGSAKILELTQRANTGDAAAEFELANAFFEGRDIPKDEGQGAALLERAARDGVAQAQFQMGTRTYGDGNSADNYVAAYVWYALAQRGGVESSDKMVSELEARMTPDQLAEARKQVEHSSISTSK
ncbi:MAG: TonB family protein [Acidobacteriia bacterium]|nr:TonB family protein [Terriglobia bacterium]